MNLLKMLKNLLTRTDRSIGIKVQLWPVPFYKRLKNFIKYIGGRNGSR